MTMLRFAANLSTMYAEHPLPERPSAAARDGFVAVEIQSPYGLPAHELRAALDRAQVELVMHNAPMGRIDLGDRGLAAVTGREDEFEASLPQAFAYANELGNRLLHVMAGVPPRDADPSQTHATYVRNLRIACDAAARHDITVLIEPINTLDTPGYFLNTQAQAMRVIEEVEAANLKLQLDFYHLQIMEGDLLRHWARLRPWVGHVQIAGVPDRHEPNFGEVNYRAIFEAIAASGYDGWIGCEYRPRGATSAGLGWRKTLVA